MLSLSSEIYDNINNDNEGDIKIYFSLLSFRYYHKQYFYYFAWKFSTQALTHTHTHLYRRNHGFIKWKEMAHCLAEEIVSSLHFIIEKNAVKIFLIFVLLVFTLVRAFGTLLFVVSLFLYVKVLCNQLGPSHLFAYNPAYNLNFFFCSSHLFFVNFLWV